jgi:hypothetical protein
MCERAKQSGRACLTYGRYCSRDSDRWRNSMHASKDAGSPGILSRGQETTTVIILSIHVTL